MWHFLTKHFSNVSSGQNVEQDGFEHFSSLVWSWLLPNCKISWTGGQAGRSWEGVKWSAPGTNAGCVNRTPPKVGGCQDREKLIVSTSYTFTRGCVAYGFECYPSSGARSGPAMPGGERGTRKRSEEQGRAGQDERTRQTSWAGLRGLLVGNSHCWLVESRNAIIAAAPDGASCTDHRALVSLGPDHN